MAILKSFLRGLGLFGIGLAAHHERVVFREQALFAIESEVCLARAGIRPVAMEAGLGQDRTNVAVERKRFRGGGGNRAGEPDTQQRGVAQQGRGHHEIRSQGGMRGAGTGLRPVVPLKQTAVQILYRFP